MKFCSVLCVGPKISGEISSINQSIKFIPQFTTNKLTSKEKEKNRHISTHS